MKSDIVLPSTNKGFLSMHFWAVVWIAVFWYMRLLSIGWIDGLEPYDFPWPHFIFYGAPIPMVIIAIVNIHGAIYGAREVTILRFGKENFLEKIICHSYGMPFSKKTNEAMFNRIIEIEVVQGSLDRLLNTGDLKLKLITFTSADSKETYWIISGIKDPYSRKEEIEKSLLLNHEGLLIKK